MGRRNLYRYTGVRENKKNHNDRHGYPYDMDTMNNHTLKTIFEEYLKELQKDGINDNNISYDDFRDTCAYFKHRKEKHSEKSIGGAVYDIFSESEKNKFLNNKIIVISKEKRNERTK